MAGLDATEVARAAALHPMPRASRTLSACAHFAAMVLAQLTSRESLRGIEACLLGRRAAAYRMGIRGRVTRTNLAYAKEHRDWRVFAAIAGVLMRRAPRLYGETPPELGLDADLFALDATVIELSLALFPWARWQKAQASVKLNVLLDVRNDRPVFASLHEGNRHEVASLDEIPVYPGCYYAIDRGYVDFQRLDRLHVAHAFFVTRLKAGLRYYVAASRPVDRTVGLRCRSNDPPQLRKRPHGLPGSVAPRRLCRSGNQAGTGLPDQPVRLGRAHHRLDLSAPLGQRTFLPLAQAAPAPARIFQQLAERRAGSNLDRPLRLPPCRYRQAAKKPRTVDA